MLSACYQSYQMPRLFPPAPATIAAEREAPRHFFDSRPRFCAANSARPARTSTNIFGDSFPRARYSARDRKQCGPSRPDDVNYPELCRNLFTLIDIVEEYCISMPKRWGRSRDIRERTAHMPSTHRIYNKEFRQEAVNLLLSSGRPIKRVAAELGVTAGRFGGTERPQRSAPGRSGGGDPPPA